jgi:hypothetical protein
MIIGSGNDLVEFASIEPDTAAFGAVIDLHPLTFGHDKVYCVAYRAFHGLFLLLYIFQSLFASGLAEQ